MGNSAEHSQPVSNTKSILKQKNQMQFEQGDFIKQIEGEVIKHYEVLSPSIQKNEFYEFRKVIHLKTKIIRLLCIVNKYKTRTTERQLLQQQIHLLKRLDSPVILKIYQLFKDSHRFYIVLEYSEGHSFSTLLLRQGYFEEKIVQSVAWQLLTLLNHCHFKGIVHGDMKLDQICFTNKKQDLLKVYDFSISRIFRIQNIIEQCLGKAFLAAPETLDEPPTIKSDIWSCGLIIHLLLCGEPLILGVNKNQLQNKFHNCKFLLFKGVSEEAKKIIVMMLKTDPEQRPTAHQLLKSSWFKQIPVTEQIQRRCLLQLFSFKVYSDPFRYVSNELGITFIQCQPSSKLLEATWIFFVNALISSEQRQQIHKLFFKLDQGSKGELIEEDFNKAFSQLLGNVTGSSYADIIMKRFNRRAINFSYFLTSCANRSFLITESNLRKIFSIFDADGSGQITVNQLKDTLGNSKEVDEQIWMQLMKEADANSDGKISFQQFKEMIYSLKQEINK